MPSHDRRAAARRRAWGRGPIILRFEPLEGRQLLAANPLPDLVGAAFDISSHTLDWGDSFHAIGQVRNQGNGPETGPFNVAIYASTNPVLGPGSLLLGEAEVGGNLGSGQSSSFDQVVSLPPTPIPGYNGQPIYITLRVDPEEHVSETNKNNNFGIGQGYDTSTLNIAQKIPSNLVGTSLGAYPDQTTWGEPVQVTAQVRNNAAGDAQPSRARIFLTPVGMAPGSGADVTLGYLDVPAIPAWQTVNVVGTVVLPAAAPTVLSSSSQFYLSMAQDADYVLDPLYPHLPNQGLGLDVVQIGVGPGKNANLPQGPKPDLAASGVIAPSQAVAWGQNIQVTTTVENLGKADAGPFDVKFVLTGASGSIDHAIFLGDAKISGLKAGYDQQIIQTLKLPNRLPSGINLNSVGVGRIAVLIDSDVQVDEYLKTNNVSESNPVTLRVLGTDGRSTVPTSPPGTKLGQAQPQGNLHPAANTPQARAAVRAAARAKAKAQLKLHRHAAPKHQSLTDKVEHNLKVFPKKVGNFFSDLFN
jgi:hypothetical protein